MTFVEAAIEILKREGKPLSSRRLAELAVKLNLLSVVGRDPESTMQERLDDALDRQVRHPDLVRLQADTFGLHAYPPRPEPANGAPTNGAPATAEGGGEPKKGHRRRRGRRTGDGQGAEEATEAAGGEAETEAGEAGAEAEAGEAGAAAEGGVEAEGEGEGAAAKAAAPAGEAGAPGEKRRRRRRGGRGRRRREGGAEAGSGTEAAGGAADADADADADEAGEDEETEATGAETRASTREATRAASEAPAAAESHEGELPPPIPEELPSEAAAAGTPADELPVDEAPASADDAELLEEEIDEHTGPLLAPALGAEDVTRTEDDRVVRPEILGSRDDRRRDRHPRGRDRHKERGGERKPHERGHEAKPHHERGHEAKAHEARPHHDKPQHDRPSHDRPSHEPRPAPVAAEPRTGGLIDTLLDVMRASDGRPMHVRQLADAAVKRRPADDKAGQTGDFARLARVALVREQRERDADGLRPRIRGLGGGNYATPDRKLDPELLQAERELAASASRLRDATRAAVRRRLGRMSPPAFDALGRTLADKLGITGLELLRRGEGVTYWGGTRAAGVGTVRTLIAFRAGEGEVNRRAVGELRAGLAAKGYDEGLLFSAGRPNGEALAELKAGGVTLYDAAALAVLVVKHGLGVRRVTMPVDYLDIEFFFELQEG